MKKYLCLLLVLACTTISGCSSPEMKESSSTLKDKTGLAAQAKKATNKTATPDSQVKGVSQTKPINSEYKKVSLPIILYYQDRDRHLIPITRKVIKQEGIAKIAISGLIDNPLSREEVEYYGIYPVIPQGTKILGLNIKDNTATIDFSDKLLSYKDEADERNIITSIVYTLTEFKTVKNVRVLINGGTVEKLKFGTDISQNLSRANIMINAKKANVANGLKKTDIYLLKYVNDRYIYMLPASREHNPVSESQYLTKIIDLLGTNIQSQKLHSEIPEGTKLLNFKINGNLLTLNLNRVISNYSGGNAREEAIMKQILYSIRQINGVQKVKILIEGEEAQLPEGTELTEEFLVPTEINNVLQ
ncbi:MAG: GerMN domain-containing protein [Clostridia bacterium]|nr:GerMN domain-containing protein [Clostridia bacterium]